MIGILNLITLLLAIYLQFHSYQDQIFSLNIFDNYNFSFGEINI